MRVAIVAIFFTLPLVIAAETGLDLPGYVEAGIGVLFLTYFSIIIAIEVDTLFLAKELHWICRACKYEFTTPVVKIDGGMKTFLLYFSLFAGIFFALLVWLVLSVLKS